ncbi:hypothetical protein B0H10DRAFT_1969029 [Mycena sp. CBHHK59/15]|nr:hypothetical protein B0H10DRAFT_1969029 [Mycena sp. CBHHK59/15]
MALIEFSVPYDAIAGIRICLQSFKPLVEVYQSAMEHINDFFAIVSVRKKRYPSLAEVAEGRKLGGIMAIWAIGSCRAYAAHDEDIYLGYQVKITALRNELGQKTHQLNAPALVPNYMEPEYAIAAHEWRLAGFTSPGKFYFTVKKISR